MNRGQFYHSDERHKRLAANRSRIQASVRRAMKNHKPKRVIDRLTRLLAKIDRIDAMGSNWGWSS